MQLFKPENGGRYSKEDVVNACFGYIYSSEFAGNVMENDVIHIWNACAITGCRKDFQII